jgi:hypothetical protein
MLVVIGHVCTEAQEFTRVVVFKSSELCSQIVLVQRARGEWLGSIVCQQPGWLLAFAPSAHIVLVETGFLGLILFPS